MSPHCAGGDVIDAYLATDAEETEPMQPNYHWTDDGTLHTDPHGMPPVLDPVPQVPESGEGVGPINQEKQSKKGLWNNGPLAALAARRRSTRRHRENGLTGTVWKKRAASAEARELADIEDPRVLNRKAKNATAGQLEELAEDPSAEAHSNRRSRTTFLVMAFVGIALGVGISSTTAQQTITAIMGWAADSAPGIAAYGADPALGLVLFAVLGVRALAASRGVVLPDNVRSAFNRIEMVLFSLVALLNIGPSIGALVGHLLAGIGGILPAVPGSVAALAEVPTDVMVLVIHSLGPVLVACGVWGIPNLLVVFQLITTATNAKMTVDSAGSAATSSLVDRRMQVPERYRGELDRVLAAIDGGELPTDPSGAEIYRYLGGGDAGKKKPLRDAVAGYRPQGVAA